MYKYTVQSSKYMTRSEVELFQESPGQLRQFYMKQIRQEIFSFLKDKNIRKHELTFTWTFFCLIGDKTEVVKGAIKYNV